jgi:hypothetical protein
MKSSIILFFFSICIYSQNKNFTVEDKIIIWKYIYEDSTNTKELQNNPRLEFKTDSTGYIKKTNFEDRKLNQLTGEFKIDSKKSKYRISVFNIKFFVEPIGMNFGNISTQTISEFTIEYSLIKKDGSFRNSNLTEQLNPHLVELFKIKKKEKKDW